MTQRAWATWTFRRTARSDSLQLGSLPSERGSLLVFGHTLQGKEATHVLGELLQRLQVRCGDSIKNGQLSGRRQCESHAGHDPRPYVMRRKCASPMSRRRGMVGGLGGASREYSWRGSRPPVSARFSRGEAPSEYSRVVSACRRVEQMQESDVGTGDDQE